jgi:hypothetical protein
MKGKGVVMNLDKLVCRGQAPWRPKAEAQDVTIWHKYDFPSCGTYRLGGHLVLFTVVADGDELSIWAYAPVPAAREAEVEGASFNSPAEMMAFIDDMLAGREVVLALAKDFKIVMWERRHLGRDETPVEAAVQFMKGLLEVKQGAPAPDVVLQAQLAYTEVATQELVDA